jgi:hypothetical protein
MVVSLHWREDISLERKIKITLQPGGKPVDGSDVPIRESTERWTEITLEDGAILRVKPMIVGVVRLDNTWDQDGNPVYALRGGPNVMAIVSIPDNLKKPANGTGSAGKAN